MTGYVQLREGDWIPVSAIVRVSDLGSGISEVVTIAGETYNIAVGPDEAIMRLGGHKVADLTS